MKKTETVNNLVLVPFFAAIVLFASAVWYVCYADSTDPLTQTVAASQVESLATDR